MNKESYVKAVAKRLTCSKARQAEFVRDLESDIAAALSAGETWEQVESRMGDPRQVAQEFNEDLSEAERAAGKKRKRTKTIASRGDRRGGRGGDHRSRSLVGRAEIVSRRTKLESQRAAGDRTGSESG